MTTKRNGAQLFFLQGAISTIKEAETARTLFRSSDTPLAEKHTHAGQTLIATDDAGSVLSVKGEHPSGTRAYSPYGHEASALVQAPFIGFNGEWFEALTQSYPLGTGYRFYNPAFMRFHVPDTMSPFGLGGLNCYAYCAGDPVNKSDPSGNFSILRFFQRRFSSETVIKNSTARIQHYQSEITKHQDFVIKKVTNYTDVSDKILYESANNKISKYNKSIEKHTKRLISNGASAPERDAYAENTQQLFDYKKPIKSTAKKLAKARPTREQNKQRELDASGLTSQEQRAYDHNKFGIDLKRPRWADFTLETTQAALRR